MFTISEIKMRGFKSFKRSDLQLVPGFNCLAGPNGSGKSNVLDAIRFALGEQSLKSLRAKKVKDLICQDSKYADVLLTFLEDGKKKHELRRAIRADGKILYRLDGKRSTRTGILEFLKKFSLDDTGRNVIAQGQVQRIIDMGGKERRTIIDGVAGISEFEDKKKEAMGELEVVENRMREANLVTGEREAFLRDLEKEKNRANSFVSARDHLKRVKATLINLELNSNSSRVEKINDKVTDSTKREDELHASLSELEKQVADVDKEKNSLMDEIGKKKKRDDLFKEMENARAELGSHTQALSDGKDNKGKIESDISEVTKEIKSEEGEISSIEGKTASLKKEVDELEKKRVSYSEDPLVAAVRSQLSSLEKEIARVREERIQREGEIRSLSAICEEKEKIAAAYTEGEGEESKAEKSISVLSSRKSEVVQMLDRLFQKEKDLNEQSAEIDRSLLDVREKIAVLRVQSSPTAFNPALRFISELKAKVNGIHGTVAELIEFDPKFAEAIDAAAGQRLLYVVVDDASTATECIKHLKTAAVGRATFIPIKEIRAPESGGGSGGLGMLMDFLRFKPEHRRAVEFLFGSTLLISNSTEAKKIGIGNARMVTLEGELFERSGLITGGKTRGGIAVSAQLSKVEKEAESLRETKNSILTDLRNIREEMSTLRKERSELEVEIRKCELETESAKKAEAEAKKRRKIAEDARKEISDMQKSVSSMKEKLSGYDTSISKLEKKISDKNDELKEAEQKSAEAMRSVEKEHQELTKSYSSRKAYLDTLLKEVEMRHQGIKERNFRLSGLKSQLSALDKKLAGHGKRVDELVSLIDSIEKKIGESSKALDALLQKSKRFEAELQEIGKRRGELNMELSKLEKQRHQYDIELATLNTRLEDLKAEMENYAGVEPLAEKGKEKLTESMRSLEQQISELGDVNMAAPEQYEKKSAEIAEIKDKLEKLRVERNAIMDMVNSIEEKKKEAFFEAFNAVNENFKNMFKYINMGEGYLHLDNPADLFNSGMYLKVKRNNRESSLEALSGGEKTLLALMFVFALQFFKPSPFYILDEVDQSLDKANSQQLAKLLRNISAQSQFIVVTHDDSIMGMAEAIMGVSRVDGISKIVGVKIPKANAN